MRFKLLIISMLMILMFGCEKQQLAPNAPLPNPFDDSIDKMFACKIDGKSWQTGGDWQFYGQPLSWSYEEASGYFDAGGNFNKDGSSQGFQIISNFKDTGSYQITHAFYSERMEGDTMFCGNYCLDTLGPQNLRIVQFDSIHKPGSIIGFFDFNLIGICEDTIRITEGRFKYSYNK